MKFFLDIASKYLSDKDAFYKRKARISLAITLTVWIITILLGCAAFFSTSLHMLFFIPVFLFFSILATSITKNFYTKSFIYNEIYENLEAIRELANKEIEKQGL